MAKKESKVDKIESLTIKQRIENLEKIMGQLDGVLNNMINTMNKVNNNQEIIGRKIKAMQQLAGDDQKLTNENVENIIIAENVAFLKNEIDTRVDSGILAKDDGEVTMEHFIVAEEVDKDGKIINPRIQFPMLTVTDEKLKEMIKGSKVGDVIDTGDNKLNLKITETYKIVNPEAKKE